jgi:hypothetical protein
VDEQIENEVADTLRIALGMLKKLKFGRPASSSATISPSTTVFSGRSRSTSKTAGYCRLKDFRLQE